MTVLGSWSYISQHSTEKQKQQNQKNRIDRLIIRDWCTITKADKLQDLQGESANGDPEEPMV